MPKTVLDKAYKLFQSCLPKKKERSPVGRPRIRDKEIFWGVLWVLKTGSPWQEMPAKYPSGTTCYRRFCEWVTIGAIQRFLKKSAMKNKKQLDLEETYIDATFVPAKRGGRGVGKTKCGKGTKIMAMVDTNGVPISLHVESASPAEITLLEKTVDNRHVPKKPARIIGDKAYDSDAHREKMRDMGIELIAPNRAGRTKKTQDGRTLRRYVRRWKIEQFFARLKNFRRILVRWESNLSLYLAFVQLAAATISCTILGF